MIFVRRSRLHIEASTAKKLDRSLLRRSVGLVSWTFKRRYAPTTIERTSPPSHRGGLTSFHSHVVLSKSLHNLGPIHPLQLPRECFASGIHGNARQAWLNVEPPCPGSFIYPNCHRTLKMSLIHFNLYSGRFDLAGPFHTSTQSEKSGTGGNFIRCQIPWISEPRTEQAAQTCSTTAPLDS